LYSISVGQGPAANCAEGTSESTVCLPQCSAVCLVHSPSPVQAFRHLAKQANTLLLPANAGDPASMVAQALGVYKTVSSSQQQQQQLSGGDNGSSGGSSGSGGSSKGSGTAAAMSGLGGGSGGSAGRKYTSGAGYTSSSEAALLSSGGSSKMRDAAAAAGVGGALGGAAMTGSGSWLPESPVFSLRSMVDE
jgi:hypothetical protein